MSSVDARQRVLEQGAHGSLKRAVEHAVSVGGMPRTLEQLRKRLDQTNELECIVAWQAARENQRVEIWPAREPV